MIDLLVGVGTFVLSEYVHLFDYIKVFYYLFILLLIVTIFFIIYFIIEKRNIKIKTKFFNWKIIVSLIIPLLLFSLFGFCSYNISNVHITGKNALNRFHNEYELPLPKEFDCKYEHFEGFQDLSQYYYFTVIDDDYHISNEQNCEVDQFLVSMLKSDNILNEYRCSLEQNNYEYYSVNKESYFFKAVYFTEEKILIVFRYTM